MSNSKDVATRARKPDQDWLVVLAKQPILGQAKTRLGRDIGNERGRELAEAFVLDTLELSSRIPNTRVLVAFAPASARAWFHERAPEAELFAQPDGDFGTRIRAATRETFRRGATRCVLIGMDTPHLQTRTIVSAFEALRSSDVCMGPCPDGGYYLIGLQTDSPRLFERIPWSTDAVGKATLERAAEAGLKATLLEPELDIDDGADLAALIPILNERPTVAAITRSTLAAHDGRLS